MSGAQLNLPLARFSESLQLCVTQHFWKWDWKVSITGQNSLAESHPDPENPPSQWIGIFQWKNGIFQRFVNIDEPSSTFKCPSPPASALSSFTTHLPVSARSKAEPYRQQSLLQPWPHSSPRHRPAGEPNEL